MIKKFDEYMKKNEKLGYKIGEDEIMTPFEYLDTNDIEDKIVHTRNKMGGDIDVKLSEVLEDYVEYIKMMKMRIQ
jgi:hypothetical protein